MLVSYLLIHIVGLTMEDSNLTEKFYQEDKIGERQLNFMSLKSMNETQSKVNSIALTTRIKEKASSAFFLYLISFSSSALFSC